MSRYAYVNGSYVAHKNASVHIEDRGFQFADGVYEVVYLYKGHLIDAGPHLDRLERSLSELEMDMPMSRASLMLVMKQLIRKNLLQTQTGLIYMQVTRGVAKRDFPYPRNLAPTLVMTARRMPAFSLKNIEKGMKVMSTPDIRWGRCDIKTTSLLAASMCKQMALDAGFNDAWFVDNEGFITEGTSNNAWIVTKEGKLQTRAPSHEILNGITRQAIIAMAKRENIEIIEKPFTLEDVYNAKEAFVTSASACLKPVTSMNDRTIGNGGIGIVSQQIAQLYLDHLSSIEKA
jgi:D-alanine transaminase